jgi:uroporphyrinogen decarboxylase
VNHHRRQFLHASLTTLAATAMTGRAFAASAAALSSRERVDRARAGKDVDRPPLTLWHHFALEAKGPAAHAEATLAFHRRFGTDLVKVMSDFPYPKPASGSWFELKEEPKPFPAQLEALGAIAAGLGREAHFVETIFNPWNVAEKLSSPEAVQQLKRDKPQQLIDALTVIARSEANHAKQAIAAGASGIFLAIANAQPAILPPEEFARFSEPFDRLILDAVSGAPLNVLHLHGDHVYLDRFYGWPAAALNYSTHGTKVPIADVRARYHGLLLAGIDEVNYRTLAPATLKAQADAARTQAGARFVLTPGCSVPNDSTPDELSRLRALYAA